MQGGFPPISSFYHTAIGQTLAAQFRHDIQGFLPQHADARWAAIGYPFPVLDNLYASDCVGITGRLGGGLWPEMGGNRSMVMDDADWPLASHSLDALVILHGLEFAQDPEVFMAEAARVLVGQGTLIAVVANRRSLWSSVEWSPWGHGQPFTANQMQDLLHRHGLAITAHIPAIFVPPVRWRPVWRIAQHIEKIGRMLCPALNGVHIFVAKKQTLSGIVIPAASRRGMSARPVPARLSGAQASVQASA